MNNSKVFILMVLEVGSFTILWNIFNRRQKNRFLRSVLVVACTSIVTILTNYIVPPMQFLINYLVLFLMLWLVFQKDINVHMLEFGLTMAILSVLQLVVLLILRFVFPGSWEKDEFPFLLLADSVCVVLSLLLYRYAPYRRMLVFHRQASAGMYCLSINLIIYIIVVKWIWNFKITDFLENVYLYLTIPILFILVNLFCLVYQTKRREREKALEDYRKYSPVILGLLEDVRRRQHEFKNHLNTIYSLMLVSDEKNMKDTILQYMDSINHSMADMEKILNIDNVVVTAILYNKLSEAQEKGIDFRYHIQKDCKLPYREHEFSEILNNLLDNAFDAVLDQETENRKAFLNVGCLEDGCVMEVGNSGDRIQFRDICRIFEAGYTTKAGENRGYGLYNVKKTVESYGGRVQLSFEKNFTIFSIRL